LPRFLASVTLIRRNYRVLRAKKHFVRKAPHGPSKASVGAYMETSLRVLGEEHPDTLTTVANLASTYRNQGLWKEAEELEV
jgi:hypothetical protein